MEGHGTHGSAVVDDLARQRIHQLEAEVARQAKEIDRLRQYEPKPVRFGFEALIVVLLIGLALGWFLFTPIKASKNHRDRYDDTYDSR